MVTTINRIKMDNKAAHQDLTYEELVSMAAGPQLLSKLEPSIRLWPHQIEAIHFIRTHKQSIINAEMGLGKTGMAIASVLSQIAFERGESYVAVVVAPKAVIPQWIAEFTKWTKFSRAAGKKEALASRIFLEYTTNTKRDILMQNDNGRWIMRTTKGFRVIFATPQILTNEYQKRQKEDPYFQKPSPTPTLLDLRGINFVVVDEVHQMRAEGIQHTAVQHIVNACSGPVVLMTGTPYINKPTDLRAILRLLSPQMTPADFAKEGLKKYASKAFIATQNLIKEQMPDSEITCCPVTMPESEIILYEAIFEGYTQALDEYDGGKDGGTTMAHIFTFLLRLRQSCIHPDLVIDHLEPKDVLALAHKSFKGQDLDNLVAKLAAISKDGLKKKIDDPEYQVPDSSKFLEAKRIILEQVPLEDKVIVTSQWGSPLIYKWFGQQFKDRKVFIYNGELNDGEKCQVLEAFKNAAGGAILILSMLAGGTGLNLQCANWMIVMHPHWSIEVERQVYARVLRPGQNKQVHIRRLFSKYDGLTIEDFVVAKQDVKDLNKEQMGKNMGQYIDLGDGRKLFKARPTGGSDNQGMGLDQLRQFALECLKKQGKIDQVPPPKSNKRSRNSSGGTSKKRKMGVVVDLTIDDLFGDNYKMVDLDDRKRKEEGQREQQQDWSF